jgi:hypothetical protein
MRNHFNRRGTTYILVMGAASIISVIGLSGMMVVRLQQRSAAMSNDWNEAGILAQSGIELGIARINADPNWRTTYANNTECAPIALGNGNLTFKLVDAALGTPGGDGSLSNNTYDPVRLFGYGRVGSTVRVFSVQLIGATPLDALRTCVSAKGTGNNKEAIWASGPLSTNGNFKIEELITANVETGSLNYGGSGAVDGTITSPAAAKAMPDPTVFDAYKRLATTISYGGGGTWKPTAPLLSATVNPISGTTNSLGIYYIAIPSDGKIEMKIDHIKGTLVVDCYDKAQFKVNDLIYWEPHSTELPILLIRHLTDKGDDELRPKSGFVTEGGQTYPSELHGLVYITGPSGSIKAKLGGGGTLTGTLITDKDMSVEGPPGYTCNWLSNLYVNPPVGFSTGHKMKIVAGSMLWEAGP